MKMMTNGYVIGVTGIYLKYQKSVFAEVSKN